MEDEIAELGYKVMPDGEFRVTIPTDKFPDFVARVIRFVPSLIVGSVQYVSGTNTPINFMIGVRPDPGDKTSKMQKLLEEFHAVNLDFRRN